MKTPLAVLALMGANFWILLLAFLAIIQTVAIRRARKNFNGQDGHEYV